MRSGPRCPFCSSTNTDAEFVDVGVGFEQVTPYICGDCEAMQIAPHQYSEGRGTEEERAVGWFRGRRPENPYDTDPDARHLSAIRASLTAKQKRRDTL